MVDIFFIDSQVQTVDGFMLPECWTHTVNDGLDEEGNPINERIEALSAWQGLFCPPVIGNTEDGKHVFHLMGSTQQADLLEAAGVLLARSYYEFQAIHSQLAARCAEAEYELPDGEQGRCKVADLPAGARVLAVRAPSKYLGLESPTVPDPPQEKLFPTQVLEVSNLDTEFMRLKEEVKIFAIPWIKANPACTEAACLGAVEENLSPEHEGAARIMWRKYAENALSKGWISDISFTSLRDLIVSVPANQLQEYLK